MLKGFKIKITNNQLVEMNELKPNRLYPVDTMDNEHYYVVLESGLQLEIPINEAEEVLTQDKQVMLG